MNMSYTYTGTCMSQMVTEPLEQSATIRTTALSKHMTTDVTIDI